MALFLSLETVMVVNVGLLLPLQTLDSPTTSQLEVHLKWTVAELVEQVEELRATIRELKKLKQEGALMPPGDFFGLLRLNPLILWSVGRWRRNPIQFEII